jgi:peptide methionine sulfoxide reductase msrA/msrB
MLKKVIKSDKEWKENLTPDHFRVLRKGGTEKAFTGQYNDHYEKGTYVCAACGTPLFSSETKYDRGTGWPSFMGPVDETHVEYRDDNSLLMKRTEVRCAACGSHLGHVFDDGPAPTHKHYCINSAALEFKPAGVKAEMIETQPPPGQKNENDPDRRIHDRQRIQPSGSKHGDSGQHQTPGATSEENLQVQKTDKATFAAGCFWGVEDKFRKVKGVISTRVGYMGGPVKNPTYELVCSDKTGHTESVEVVFDPRVISYPGLLGYFFLFHDPTQINRQGPDVGTQYRSVVFYHSNEQKEAAVKMIESLEKSGKYEKPIATQIVPALEFYQAEDYHQQYLEKLRRGV